MVVCVCTYPKLTTVSHAVNSVYIVDAQAKCCAVFFIRLWKIKWIFHQMRWIHARNNQMLGVQLVFGSS